MERARMTAGADDGFGDLLRRARRAAGHSQEELAERAGISARAISDLERGVNRVPRRDTLELIADALDLPKDERRRWERARRTMATQGGQADVRQPDDASTSGVPVPLTALVGREREIAEIRGLLFEGGVRLLTLTGPGGVGKTRLAVEVAQHAQAEDPKGVSFVSLGAVRNSDRVLAEIGRALRVREQAGTPIIDRLISHLASMRLLLVLDNVEQVIEAAGSFAVLLERCPALKLLVTSRTPLRIRGEQQYAVAPLAVPDGRRPPNVSTLADYPAVDLFVLRATQANSSFALTDENAATVAEICMRLDGLPLAIELAAARITALSPRMLLERLERPLALLAGGPRDLPDRQRTMRAAIQWSNDLLEPEEQRLFRRLSVFVGGWTLEAAEAVCETGVDTLDALVSLVEHGLVQHVEQLDGTTRYRMLEPIREFGLEQSRAAGEIGEAQQQLARFIARLIESGEPPRYWSPISDAWLQRCAIEHANIRTALDWRLEHEPVGALRLASSLYWFWRMHGYLIEGTRWLEEALHLNDGAPAPDRAKAIASLADLACWQSQFDR
ncbi:MAG TPA: helix-turn-helix domain-containing protein, partial [Thermomicrobiales bacterium]|nr:helix-turn-helix domain-containing protein [Thermomicrobiales bacterium]